MTSATFRRSSVFNRVAAATLVVICAAVCAPNAADSTPVISLDDWTAHDGYGITEEQRRVERDGEEMTATDRVLTVPELDMEFVWLEALDAWVGRYEVTNAQYRVFEPEFRSPQGYIDGRYRHDEVDFNTGDRPAVGVHMEAGRHRPPRRPAVPAFIEWLNEREREAGRLPEGWRFDLPTGEQWTAFARCGDERRFPWGDDWPPACGNYADETAIAQGLGRFVGETIDGYEDGHAHTAPVQESGRNDWGLYGVGGNVAEWTLEEDAGRYAARGASWAHSSPLILTVDYRIWMERRSQNQYTGFRLVLTR